MKKGFFVSFGFIVESDSKVIETYNVVGQEITYVQDDVCLEAELIQLVGIQNFQNCLSVVKSGAVFIMNDMFVFCGRTQPLKIQQDSKDITIHSQSTKMIALGG